MPRRTQQRTAIRQALEIANRPLSAPEVLAAAQDKVPGLGIATVYRNIKTLVEEGYLKTVTLPGDSNRYELATREGKHYFRCRKTGRVFSVQVELPDFQDALPEGFDVDSFVLLLEGTSPEA